MFLTLLFYCYFMMPAIEEPVAVPTFEIVEVRVEGARWVSEELIRSETRIQLGTKVTEKVIMQAERRIGRLPFILGAETSLARGPTYGTYVLVVRVWEVKPWFFDLSNFREEERLAFDIPGDDVDGIDEGLAVANQLSFGIRQRLGKYAFAYALGRWNFDDFRLEAQEGNPFDVGLNYYNVLGTGAFLNFNLQIRGDVREVEFDDDEGREIELNGSRPLAPSLSFVWPVSQNQWLTASYSHFEEKQTFDSIIEAGNGKRRDDHDDDDDHDEDDDEDEEDDDFVEVINDRSTEFSLRWTWDTTNDLTVPTHGMRLDFGLVENRYRSQFDFDIVDDDEEPEEEAESHKVRLLEYEVAKYWPWRNRYALHAATSGNITLHDGGGEEERKNRTLLYGGFSADLWGLDRTVKYGDLRFELLAGFRHELYENRRDESFFARAGVQYRSSWGRVNLGVHYSDREVTARSNFEFEGEEEDEP